MFESLEVLGGIRIPPALFILLAIVAVVSAPLPGRGPMSRTRDPWRGYKFASRDAVMQRAGHRCEGAVFLVWGRCGLPAVEVDHVYPWSKGGKTVVRNGQALCRDHNRRKAAVTPPWWYVLGLERRRRGYFPEVVDVRVFARYTPEEREARQRWLASRQAGRRR